MWFRRQSVMVYMTSKKKTLQSATSRLQGSYTTLDFCSSFCSWYGLMTSNKENIAFDFGSFVVRYGVGNIMYSLWRQCLDMQSSKVDMKHLPWSLEVAPTQVSTTTCARGHQRGRGSRNHHLHYGGRYGSAIFYRVTFFFIESTLLNKYRNLVFRIEIFF